MSDTVDTLLDVIDYTILLRDRGDDGIVWLDDWRHGDAEAMAELAEWRARK